jgi:hypothetical protein
LFKVPYNHFGKTTKVDRRHVLVRVIVPRTETSRDQIIKATNSQTAIPPASLRATEQIHRDIEAYFATKSLFYDRRKNFYKNQGKPISDIVGIPYLAQAVLAIALQEPDNSRARPSSLLKEDADHERIFNPKLPLPLFLQCCVIMRRIEAFLKGHNPVIDATVRNNLRFYLGMVVTMRLCELPKPSAEKIAALDVTLLTDIFLEDCLVEVVALYQKLGGTDRVAKGTELGAQLRDAFMVKFKAGKFSAGTARTGSP